MCRVRDLLSEREHLKRMRHCEVRGIISSGKEIHSPFRHGHQQIFLMKVELFWYSEMKIRSFQHSTV